MTTTQISLTPERIHERLVDLLTPEALQWAEVATAAITADPGALLFLSASAGMRCGRTPLGPDFGDWTADDAVRVLLLASIRLDGVDLAAAVQLVYRQGDGAERRAVLRALPLLDFDEKGVPLVRDALRTNDKRLVTAALGPYAADHLDQASWRDGVLKCVFMGIPLAEIAGFTRRADAELIRMFRDYAAERTAANRPVPADLCAVLDSREN